jgi:hypothetical protein
MSEATTATAEESVEIPNTAAELTGPVFEVIEPNAARTCDAHPSTYALVLVTLPSGGKLELCGNCGRKHFGWEHTKSATPENRQKGSAH